MTIFESSRHVRLPPTMKTNLSTGEDREGFLPRQNRFLPAVFHEFSFIHQKQVSLSARIFRGWLRLGASRKTPSFANSFSRIQTVCLSVTNLSTLSLYDFFHSPRNPHRQTEHKSIYSYENNFKKNTSDFNSDRHGLPNSLLTLTLFNVTFKCMLEWISLL